MRLPSYERKDRYRDNPWRAVESSQIAAHAHVDIDLVCVQEILTDSLPALLTTVEQELNRPHA